MKLEVVTDAAGLPLGVQVLARFGSDRMALSAAAWLEMLLANAGIAAPKSPN